MIGTSLLLFACSLGAPPDTPLANRLIALGRVELADPQSLFFLDPEDTSAPRTSVVVSGVASGDSLITIANEPWTGTLYGYSLDRRLYTIDKTSGVATEVGSANSGLPGISGPEWFWIRFDPVAGALRFVHVAHGNYRIDRLTNLTIASDTPFAFASGDVHSGSTDGVISLVYTNYHDAATTTEAFMMVGNHTWLTTLPDVANGQMTTIGDVGYYLFGNGGMAWDLDGSIYAASNITFSGVAGPTSEFYRIDPVNGNGSFLGELGSPPIRTYDIAIDYDPTSSDRDRDGFPNVIEDLATADSRDPNDTPFPGVTQAPTKASLTTLANRLRIGLRFDVANKDTLQLKGAFQLAPNEEFERNGARIIVDVGGSLSLFDLNAKGKATAANGAKIKVSKPTASGVVKYVVTRKNASLATAFSDEGLTNTTVAGASADIDVDLWLESRHVGMTKTVTYDAVAGSHGKAHE